MFLNGWGGDHKVTSPFLLIHYPFAEGVVMNNIIPTAYKVSKIDRRTEYAHRSFVLWFTGLSGSGKSTLAKALEYRLFDSCIHTYGLDGDNIRTGLNSDLGFSLQDRIENIRRLGEVVKLFIDAGIVVTSAFISPLKKDRKRVQNLLSPGDFVEVYVKCPLEVCEQRDVKGLYKKARKGLISNFTGIDSPYEEPDNPSIIVDTNKYSEEECCDQIFDYLLACGYIKGEN